MSHPGIVVIGNANVDLTTYVEAAPSEGETVLGHDFTIGMGGKGANQAVAAARAGGTVSFIGRVGDDTFGALMLSNLGQEGLHLQHLQQIPGKSGVASIYVDANGANRIAVYTGASGTIDGTMAETAVAEHTGIRYLVSQLEISHEAVAAALATAKKLGATTVLNIAPYSELEPGILDNTDWLIANEGEIEAVVRAHSLPSSTALTPNALRAALPDWAKALGCNLVVTLGEQGAVGYVPGDEPWWYSTPPVTALDTVGAGDCFVGYFVAFLDQGLSWQQALAGGVIAASESVQRAGAQSSYPEATLSGELASKARSVG
jgi:ribokinase